ncbi:LysR family transcriptional regulator [Leisingera sp. D0M16]|uniref:LysR family transcriptional regulator n=1 Tax=Leisingera coralii TaxID=3351347 RepID=UPI003B76C349
MSRRIPLHQINAFEAAARCLSFSRAAQELNVQQPAVSRHIAALEADLGVSLFLRSKPRLTLTEEGEILAGAVAAGFDAIREGLETLRARSGDETIIVSASIGFTSLYLLPRLAGFQAAFPDIKLQVITRDQNADFDPGKCDAVILFGEDGLAGAESRLIFKETMIAVCHPGLLRDGAPMDLPSLGQQKLLHLNSSDHNKDWNRFFQETGVVPPKPPAHDSYLSYMVYLRAIQNGLGVGIGWRHILDEFLANGTLALACEHECKTQRGYYCSLTPTGARKAGTTYFLDWIGRLE